MLEKVKHCWHSLFTPRAIFYRTEQNLQKADISVAVVVQKMVNSEIAGVFFTVHPVTKDPNQIIIEAVWGLGETLVQGMVTPDSYVLDKRDYSIIDVSVNEQEKMFSQQKKGSGMKEVSSSKKQKRKLNDEELKKLSEIGIKIEKHYGMPMDIEWAYEKGKFYIVQARPITTL